MIKSLTFIFLACLISTSVFAQEAELTRTDQLDRHHVLLEMLDTYIQAGGHGDVETLASLFHPDAIMVGDRYGEFIWDKPEVYIEDASNRSSPIEDGEAILGVVTQANVDGMFASAVVQFNNYWCSAGTNHLQLIYEQNQWQIISMVFWFRPMPINSNNESGSKCY